MKPYIGIGRSLDFELIEALEGNVVLAVNYSDEAGRIEVLNEYSLENGVTLGERPFKSDKDVHFFELWIDGKCCGILSVRIISNMRLKKDPHIDIELLSVFILKAFRSKEYTAMLSDFAAGYIEKKIIKEISTYAEKAIPRITLVAEAISSKGENFATQFFSRSVEYNLPIVIQAAELDVDIEVCIDGLNSSERLGDTIRDRRIDSKLDCESIASAVNCSVKRYRNIEDGLVTPTETELRKLEEILGVRFLLSGN